ncbi:MAG TPA: shikimate dehydrogenase [Bauldia sp.]|nr:shikimate dehydrogenase [Bauldia sp.]
MVKPVACVIGWPVKHSRSPVIHKFWLREYGIDGDYVLHPVEPEKVAAFFAGFADSGFVGGNVTVPHKEAAFAAVAKRDAAAEATGALNTLWLESGTLVGANTDVAGFLANLDEEAPGWDEKKGAAVVLGAGGAARAIVWGLLSRGLGPVHVVNRDPARPKALATRFGAQVKPARWVDVPSLLIGARLLVNTTTLGMAGQPLLKIDLAPLPTDAVVNDIVYVPRETELLKAARWRNLRTAEGLGMLLHQAVPGFDHWFGRRPVVTAELRRAVQKSIDEG